MAHTPINDAMLGQANILLDFQRLTRQQQTCLILVLAAPHQQCYPIDCICTSAEEGTLELIARQIDDEFTVPDMIKAQHEEWTRERGNKHNYHTF